MFAVASDGPPIAGGGCQAQNAAAADTSVEDGAVPGTGRVFFGRRRNGYGTLSRAHTFSSSRATSGRPSEAAKFSAPAAKTFAPDDVS